MKAGEHMVHSIKTEKLEQYISNLEKRYQYRQQIIELGKVCLLLSSVILILVTKQQFYNQYLQSGIAEQIIRFHVLANSDSEEDQCLKRQVKTEVVSYLQDKLNVAKTKEEAETIIRQEEEQIQKIAKNKITSEGYSYDVEVKLEPHYFPIKKYGDLTFPSGQYEALRVLIGKAEGRNWWCVMFPSLCFVDESYSVVPEESKEKLQHVLTEEEYEELGVRTSENGENSRVEVHFGIVDFLSSCFD